MAEWIQAVAEPPPKEAVEDEHHAAKSLVHIVKSGTTCLEYLFIRRNALIQSSILLLKQ